MSELVSLTRDGEIGVITVNNPPVNALSPGVPEGIAAALEQVKNDDSIKGVVLIGGGRTFIAGADIKEFGKITSGQRKRDLNFLDLIKAIEDCPKPMVAAIHGTAFGGGLETAMGLLPRRRSIGPGRPARGQAGYNSRRGRHAAVAAIGGRRQGHADVRRR